MADVKQLLATRKYLKGRMTMIENSLLDPETLKEISELEGAMTLLQEFYKKFEVVQIQLEAEDDKYSADGTAISLKHYELFKKINSNLFKLKKAEMTSVELNASSSTGSASTVSNHSTTSLPKITLPSFSGEPTKWLSFKDMFLSMVHNVPESELGEIKKFHYLKTCLKGTALSLISSIECTSENYTKAWDKVVERFDNKCSIANSHIKGIFELPKASKNSHQGLRSLLSEFSQHYDSLEALKVPSLLDLFVVFILSEKIDTDTMRDFEIQKGETDYPTIAMLEKFLTAKCRALETHTRGESHAPVKDNKRSVTCVSSHKQIPKPNSPKCVFCEHPHPLFKCFKFKKMDPKERRSFATKLKLCSICLSAKHTTERCNSTYSGCNRCSQRHHELMHIDEVQIIKEDPIAVPSNNSTPSMSQSQFHCLGTTSDPMHNVVLLSTAVVQVADVHGSFKACRVLLDSASEKNFVTRGFMDRLNLPRLRSDWQISGVGGNSVPITETVNIDFESRVTDLSMQATFGVIDQITDRLPRISFEKSQLKWPSFVRLADPDFNINGDIDMLIGAEIFYKILQKGKINLCNNNLVLQNTALGWIFGGCLKGRNNSNSAGNFISACTTIMSPSLEISIDENLKKFWQLEEIVPKRILSRTEKKCEELYESSVSRTFDGRYEVDLPIDIEKLKTLGNSFKHAFKCFLSLEKKFAKNLQFFNAYRDFIHDFISLGHATEISNFPYTGNNPEFYMPHHAVIKESSSTTKLRVVFNGSAKSDTGVSLNDIMYVGPVVQPTLFSVLLRFRTYLIGIVTDIAMMYRMVHVKAKYQPLQRILWRDEGTSLLKCFQLNTVTYGTASASFQATRTLVQLVKDEGDEFPLASKALQRNTYVDDVITGTNDLKTALDLQDQLIKVLGRGKFSLHKWYSNNDTILNRVPVEKRETCNFNLPDGTQSLKTLGLFWNPELDVFQVTVPDEISVIKLTKRNILSAISKIYDPLGLVSVVVISAKIIVQNIWKDRLGWDSPVSLDTVAQWNTFINTITQLKNIKIPRVIFSDKYTKFELHGFADSSMKAYGCVIYLRAKHETHNSYMVRLVCSKSKVAPAKPVSLPRLELCASLLLARLLRCVLQELQIEIKRYFCWTDSLITLAWIKSDPSRWNIFVANRVSEIQDNTEIDAWQHVPSSDNPADIITRGITPDLLQSCSLWWQGPSWLSQSDEFWVSPKVLEAIPEPPESKKVCHLTCAALNTGSYMLQTLHRFTKWWRLQRTLAFILRFSHNAQHPKNERMLGNLSISELRNSTLTITKILQAHYFAKELSLLKEGRENSTQVDLNFSKLKYLNPFVDDNGVLRVGGRLRHAKIPTTQRFPIILPSNDPTTKLIIVNEHERLLHAGAQTTLASLRLKFWVINGRNVVRLIIRKCIRCFRFVAVPPEQMMADLPSFRVTPHRPFLYVGIDYTGAIEMKQSRLRKSVITKGYVCLFICLSTKAIHLELCSDMSTATFMAALRRFFARRGKCKSIFSDNGSNFKGASNELKELYRLLNKSARDTVINELSKEEIEWRFITPLAAHHGGIWESGIKKVKYHLKRVMRSSLLTYEELNTLLVQIEAIINSRPLHPLSSEPDELTCLTPAHFLINESMQALPEGNFIETPMNRLSLWNQIQKLRQFFWKRWSMDYLHSLQQRTKWLSSQENVTPNMMVLLRDDNAPPLQWCLGRIVEVFPGSDKRVRSVSVRTASGVYTRPITKISLLPID